MIVNKLKIRLYSEIKDIYQVRSAIEKLPPDDYQLKINDIRDLTVEPDYLNIFQVVNIESGFFSKIAEAKNFLIKKSIFIVPDGKALLISTLVKLGFTDIFVFPFEVFSFTSFIAEISELRKRRIGVDQIGNLRPDFFSVGSTSSRFHKINNITRKVAKNTSLNVLILGETGTGKGILSRTIHDISSGREAPFVDVLCTAIPETLLESELFGYEKGAFTNAQTRKPGLFELAENGTLFLDEIGDLSLKLQSKLLRVIEKKVIRRLGGLYDIPINTRIISATNKDLQDMIEKKLFRSDLYYRLNVVGIELPPLRHRGKDILLFAEYFLDFFNRQFNKQIKRIEKDAQQFLLEYSWPGNVRELRNAIERAVLLGDGKNLKSTHFSHLNEYREPEKISNIHGHEILLSLHYRKTSLKKLNKLYALQVLDRTKGNKSLAAGILGISRPTLDTLIR
jgi:two-component system, NtrC family, response regulator AtoC